MMWLIVGLIAVFVYYDATKNKIGKIPEEKGFLNMSAGLWSFGVLLLWIVIFPLYLIKRSSLIEKAKEHPQNVSMRGAKLALLSIYTVVSFVMAVSYESYLNTANSYAASNSASNISASSNSASNISASSNNASSNNVSSDSADLDRIWNAYTNWPGNAGQGIRYDDVKGRMLKKGTVPPSAMNSSVKERLPAYLACFEHVMISSLGDVESELCMYYVRNPKRGNHALMWRGPDYMDALTSNMSSDGFIEG